MKYSTSHKYYRLLVYVLSNFFFQKNKMNIPCLPAFGGVCSLSIYYITLNNQLNNRIISTTIAYAKAMTERIKIIIEFHLALLELVLFKI